MLLKWSAFSLDKHISVCGYGFRVADDVSRDGVGEWTDWWQERESKGNERHNAPVAWLSPPLPHSHPHPHWFSLGALGQVRSSGFLAPSRDAPIDPCYCGFIKTFPPLSFCVWLHVSLWMSVCVRERVLFVCRPVSLICQRALLLFCNRVNITEIRKYYCYSMNCSIVNSSCFNKCIIYIIIYSLIFNCLVDATGQHAMLCIYFCCIILSSLQHHSRVVFTKQISLFQSAINHHCGRYGQLYSYICYDTITYDQLR